MRNFFLVFIFSCLGTFAFADFNEMPSLEKHTPLVKEKKLGFFKRLALKKLKKFVPDCDQIVTKKGDVIAGKIVEVGTSEIKYKKCDDPNSPIYAVLKSDILSLVYGNGTVEKIETQPNNKQNTDPTPKPIHTGHRKVEGFGVASFILALIGGLSITISILGLLIFGLLAVIFAGVSLSRIGKNPESLSGRGFAIVGLIIGLIILAYAIAGILVL